MSCSQVAAEFTKAKFRLVYPHPSAFAVWRYTCFTEPRGYYIYRVICTAIFILLLAGDFLWIFGFAGAGAQNEISASLDASQLSLIALCLAYVLLTCVASRWVQIQLEPNAEQTLFYKFPWFVYTCALNSVYVCMIVFWVTKPYGSTLEQKIKHSIPGILALIDLCLTSIPLYLCHFVYVILIYLAYLVIAVLSLFLSYETGLSDKTATQPSNPTVWVGGAPLLPDGFSDFTSAHLLLSILFGSMALALIVHCILLCIVILRDFLASLFGRSTEAYLGDDPLFAANRDPITGQSSTAESVTSTPRQEKAPLYAENAGFDGVHEDTSS